MHNQIEALRVFVRIVEAGNFTRAAASLNMPKTTVSAIVRNLEDHVSTKLLSRTTRRVSVTSEGAQYYEGALQVLSQIQKLDDGLTQRASDIVGTLRVEMPSSLAMHVFVPRLQEFSDLHPKLRLDLSVSDRPVDYLVENVDCAIRVGELRDRSLIRRKLPHLKLVTCASPEYLQRFGEPAHPSELVQRHRLIGYLKGATGARSPLRFVRDAETLDLEPGYLAANEAATCASLAKAGLGIVQVAHFLVEHELATGKLKEVLPNWQAPALPLNLVYPPNRSVHKRLRAFLDWAPAIMKQASL